LGVVVKFEPDLYTLKTVYLSIIIFDREAKILVPLTELDGFTLPNIETPETYIVNESR
jgi:uncharacterized protein YegL